MVRKIASLLTIFLGVSLLYNGYQALRNNDLLYQKSEVEKRATTYEKVIELQQRRIHDYHLNNRSLKNRIESIEDMLHSNYQYKSFRSDNTERAL